MKVTKDYIIFTEEDKKNLFILADAAKKIQLPKPITSHNELWLKFVEQYTVYGGSGPLVKLKKDKERYEKFKQVVSLDNLLSTNEELWVKVLTIILKEYKATRFYNQQANNLAICLKNRLDIFKVIQSVEDPEDIRDRLIELCPNFSMKSASDYIITIGKAKDFIAFDTRIESVLRSYFNLDKRGAGYIRRYPEIYRLLEYKIRRNIRKTGVKLGQLDRLIFKIDQAKLNSLLAIK